MKNKNMLRTILIIEDDENVLVLNQSVLIREGYSVLTARSLADARQLLVQKPAIDITVLDILLPDGNGLDFVSELRRYTHSPILILTGKRAYEDMVKGLTGGADDYMTKPYRIEELLARLVALLHRRDMAGESAEMCRGPLTLDTVSQRAYLYGKDLLLQPREYALLTYLIQHENEWVMPEYLYEAVWKLPTVGSRGAVKTAVSRLRKKIMDSGYTIISVRGTGYCFKKNKRAAPL